MIFSSICTSAACWELGSATRGPPYFCALSLRRLTLSIIESAEQSIIIRPGDVCGGATGHHFTVQVGVTRTCKHTNINGYIYAIKLPNNIRNTDKQSHGYRMVARVIR